MQGLHFKNLKGSQQGFTLVTVLIMSMMAGVLVLNSLKDNVAQERLSGNFQKKMNARLVAEKGVFDTYNYLNAQLAANPNQTLDQLIAAMQTSGSASGISNMSYNLIANIPAGSNQLFLQSDGERFDGETKLKANFELVSGSSQSSSGFGGGVIGCDGISLSGSGIIDSYDSSLGDYNSDPAQGEINKNANVTVRTLNDNDIITLSGASIIDGDLIAIGKVNFGGSAHIAGNVHSNDSITMLSDSTIGGNASAFTFFKQTSGSITGAIHANSYVNISETPVGGDITSMGEVTADGETIGGDILSQGDISLTRVTVAGLGQTYANYKQVEGSINGVKSKGNVTLSATHAIINNDNLRFAGAFNDPSDPYASAPYKVSPPQPQLPQVPLVEKQPIDDGILDPNDPNDLTCDPLDIENAVLTVDSFADSAKDLIIKDTGKGASSTVYTLSNTRGEYSQGGGSGAEYNPIPSTNATFLGDQHNILMYDNVKINGNIEIKPGHNVVLYAKGGFYLQGASTLTIPDNSSLTLIVKGALIIGSGSTINTPTNGLTQAGIPVFSIYSSYSGTGVDILGGVEQIYAAIYAPLSDVEIASDVAFKGSVLGKKVDISGAGGIHYDEALGLGHVGNVVKAAPPSLVFKGWQSY
ncbi:hypothetical protein TUM4438_34790 [Shewanella sairae]|uniref:DUF7305 domain-containing protein n=1 Tax=Shewanella sairae TaxID=190310 RepID=A0ABQ4PNQ2_9GAMM|nr:hypothetical protein [Shewanella sairae]MCL1130972.1 hypothetical protein [Shewanella sairae]GIU49996.1 hypothetical protein TUM4438_34790 [Shewanella sairae]